MDGESFACGVACACLVIAVFWNGGRGLAGVRRFSKVVFCPHCWVPRRPTYMETKEYVVSQHRFWVCAWCGKKIVRAFDNPPISW